MAESEKPQPTLDDLLAACDLAEEGGAPPAVVGALREAALIRDVFEQCRSRALEAEVWAVYEEEVITEWLPRVL